MRLEGERGFCQGVNYNYWERMAMKILWGAPHVAMSLVAGQRPSQRAIERVIHEPRGKAREYAPLAVNLYSGYRPRLQTLLRAGVPEAYTRGFRIGFRQARHTQAP